MHIRSGFVTSNSRLNGVKQPLYYPQGFGGPGVWAGHSWDGSSVFIMCEPLAWKMPVAAGEIT